ncbi:hypothetical protein JYT15_00630, partial [Acidimicrobium ferrooxidans]|nr:hypothetical protein [Acidimicrobium ferrooxidans]
TLIEILLAIAVLVIGIVGLLPMFYAGLYKTKVSVQLSTAAVVISSVTESIKQSMRLDAFDSKEQAKGENWVQYWHAGAPKDVYFQLPETGTNLGFLNKKAGDKGFHVEVPKDARTGPLGGGASVGLEVFPMGGERSAGFPMNIPPTNVEKDQLKTYQFNFMVRPTSHPHLDNVYEFVIRVYRNYRKGDPKGNEKQLIQEVHLIVSGN